MGFIKKVKSLVDPLGYIDLFEIHTEKKIDLTKKRPYAVFFKINIIDNTFLSYLDNIAKLKKIYIKLAPNGWGRYRLYIDDSRKIWFHKGEYSVNQLINEGATYYCSSKKNQDMIERQFVRAFITYFSSDIKRYQNAKTDQQLTYAPKSKIEVINEYESNVEFSLYVPHLSKVRYSNSDDWLKSEKVYNFNCNYDIYKRVNDEIYPILNKFGDFSLITVFHDDIHYCLSNLRALLDLKEGLDIDKEIDTVLLFFRKVEKYVEEINIHIDNNLDRFSNDNLDHILSKHHLAMKQLMNKVDLFTYKK
ncbi:hypothetical protein AB9M62_25640 [Bacillales bacterium AN1005]